MAIRTLLRYRNLDKTSDLNERFVGLINPGVFDGGLITPIAAQLSVSLGPWKVYNADGMVAEETSAIVQLATPAGQTTVIAVKAVYVSNNDPIVETVALELSAFNALPDPKDYIIFGQVIVPVGATQTLTTYIDYTTRMTIDKVGRNFDRGVITSAGFLPTSGNLPGDYYGVVDGVGGPLNLYGWNGYSWQVLTDFVGLNAQLQAHRQNLYTNEKHLTDDQAVAVQGSSGSPVGSSNPLIDSDDPRVPTFGEAQALAGSHGSPSDTNRYLTQQFPFALTEEASTNTTPVDPYFEILATDGPIYVGRLGIGSASVNFQFYHLNETREFTTSSGQILTVAGVYTDSGLTQILDPSSNPNVDVFGFYLNNPLYIAFSVPPDAGLRLLYGKRYLMGTYPIDAFLRRGIRDGETTGQTVTTIENIKGRPFTTNPPVKEQNINLRKDMVSTREYLASVFRADHVVSDFSKVENVPDFAGDFVENVGIPQNYSFQNSGLVGFSYNSTTGTVSFSSVVNLASVTAGQVFLDGSLTEYKVISIGVNSVVIAERDGGVPASINTSVSTSDHGSIKPDNNPRQVNLSTLDVIGGKERINVREIEYVSNEFHPVTGNVAFQIRTPLISPFYREPRIRFYGGFFNRNAGVQSQVVCNGSGGRILITGFFNDVLLLAKLSATSPTIQVFVDGSTVATTIDLSRSGLVFSYGTSVDIQQKPTRLVENLADGVPHTVEVVVTSSPGELVVYGFDLIRRDNTSAKVLPGRSFVQADLFKSDSIVSLSNSPVTPQGRGAVSTIYVNRSLAFQTSNYPLTDFDGTSGTPAGLAVAATPLFSVTSGLAKFQYFKAGDVVALVTAAATEVKVIQTIGPAPGLITFSNNVGISGSAELLHLASTSGDPTDPTREYVRFYSDQMGLEQTTDFSLEIPLLADRSYTMEDGTTSIAGKGLLYITTGIDGIDRALSFNDASSTLRIRAVCNRMDILIANPSPVTMNYSVDGSPTLSYNVAGNGLVKVSILLNARYQTHELSIFNSAGLAYAGLILHEPTLPTNPEGSLIGTQNLIASYAVGSTITGNIIPVGAVALDPFISGGIFVNSAGFGNPWSYSLDFVNNPAYGRYFSTDQSLAYFEYEFIGEGFELEYFAGPDRGIALVYLNGIIANSTNYSATFRGVAPATGKVDMYATTVTRSRFGISGLSRSKYKVTVQVQSPRAKNVSSTGFLMNITCIYLLNTNGSLAVTPSHSFYNDLEQYHYGEDQVRDERNFDSGAVARETVPILRTVLAPTRSGKIPLPAGTTSVVVSLSSAMPSGDYVITANLFNNSDTSPQFQPITIVNQTQSTFTASWNSPLDTGNYSMNYIAIVYN